MKLPNPLRNLSEDAWQSFPGQQEGERILYMIRPAWTRELFGFIKIGIVVAVILGALNAFNRFGVLHLAEVEQVKAYIVVALSAALAMLWYRQVCEHSRAYITDRRFVRFEGAVPEWQSQRALFWSDVVKTRTFAGNMIFRMLKIGIVELIPNFAVEGQNIVVGHAHLYGDLGNYIDKIVYTFRNKPAEMGTLREFVPKPKGQRYPGVN